MCAYPINKGISSAEYLTSNYHKTAHRVIFVARTAPSVLWEVTHEPCVLRENEAMDDGRGISD